MPLDKTKIRQRREKLGLTITDASAKAGILRPAWSKYEAGNDLNVKLEAAEKIARALRCSLTAITSQD